MNSASIVTTYQNEAGSTTVKTETLTGNLSQNIEETAMSANTSAAEFDVSIPKLYVRAFAIGCKKATGDTGNYVVLTVKTNDNTSPGDTYTITPTNGISWSTGDSTTIPISTNITKLFVTAATAPTGSVAAAFDFSVRVLLDSTPSLTTD